MPNQHGGRGQRADLHASGATVQEGHRRESDGELLVLGDWIERRTYARLEDGVFRLEDFRDAPGMGRRPESLADFRMGRDRETR